MINPEEGYDVLPYTDEEGNEQNYAFLLTKTINGIDYSVLVDERSFLLSDSAPEQAEFILVKATILDGEDVIISLEEEEFQSVIQEIEEALGHPSNSDGNIT